MTKSNLPPLPEPDFAAPTLYQFTEDQVRAIQLEAWNKAMELAAVQTKNLVIKGQILSLKEQQ